MAVAKENKGKIDFRKLKECSLVTLVIGGQPVIFERIKRGKGKSDDSVLLICLDPVWGLCRREYYLRNNSGYIGNEYTEQNINPASKEGRKYLELMMGK